MSISFETITKFCIILSPLEQFELIPFLQIKTIPIFNITVFLGLCSILLVYLSTFFNKQSHFAISKINRLFYFIKGQFCLIFIQNFGIILSQVYQNWLSFSFFFLCFLNLLGMIPYIFTIISHFAITLTIALFFFSSINLRAFVFQRLLLFKLFLPKNIPLLIINFLILIEFISYFTRVLSLSIRLFANIIAGHILLKILIMFAFGLFGGFWLFGWQGLLGGCVIFFIVIIIIFLESAIACLQAYVFTVLSCLYIKDLYISH